MAERGGFEPPVGCYPYNCLAGSCLQPLGHLSRVFAGTFGKTEVYLYHEFML
jgi:hypothetical protein